jgi:hypothetical protein
MALLHADVSHHFLDRHATYVSQLVVPLAGEGLPILSKVEAFKQCS